MKEQEEFDIEKWRKETPMDYNLAIELLKKDSSEEVFWAIWKVAKLHITKKVYKYYSLTEDMNLNKLKLQTLKNKKVFLSPMSSLNDPFEGKAHFYEEKNLRNIERLKKHNGKLIDDFSSLSLVTSMTKNSVNSMPMWAHYSSNHAGYCVEYDTDINENKILKSLLMPVQYTNERLNVTDIIKSQAEKIEALIENNIKKGINEIALNDFMLIWLTAFYSCVKHSSWGYENEVRVLIGKNENQYINALPASIFIGVKCTEYNKKQLIGIANHLKVPAFQMYFDEYSNSFELKYEKLN